MASAVHPQPVEGGMTPLAHHPVFKRLIQNMRKPEFLNARFPAKSEFSESVKSTNFHTTEQLHEKTDSKRGKKWL